MNDNLYWVSDGKIGQLLRSAHCRLLLKKSMFIFEVNTLFLKIQDEDAPSLLLLFLPKSVFAYHNLRGVPVQIGFLVGIKNVRRSFVDASVLQLGQIKTSQHQLSICNPSRSVETMLAHICPQQLVKMCVKKILLRFLVGLGTTPSTL